MSDNRETGWLIELTQSVVLTPTWYGESDEGVLGWTTDNLKAVRFARKEDAERVIELGTSHARGPSMTWLQYIDRWAAFGLGMAVLGLAAMLYGCAG